MTDPFAPIDGRATKSARKAQADWTPIVPAPDDAPKPPAEHFTRGKPFAEWKYYDAKGKLLGLVWRFQTGPLKKEFIPVTFCRNAASGRTEWRYQSWGAPRPLYGLERLAQRPDAPVLICEGEKSADAAGRMIPSMVAITSPGGAKAAAKADWSVLKGRDCVIWPDADTPGAEYAADVARQLRKVGALSISILRPSRYQS